jgi:hypothetical protein
MLTGKTEGWERKPATPPSPAEFDYHKFHAARPGIEAGPPLLKAGD